MTEMEIYDGKSELKVKIAEKLLTGVREIVFLKPRLPPRHDVRNNVLLVRVLIYPVGPLVDRHHLAPFLVNGAVSRLKSKKKKQI